MKYIVEKNEAGTFWRNEQGEYHREDGPACEYTNGDKHWYLNGECHRVDGPAVEFTSGTKHCNKLGLKVKQIVDIPSDNETFTKKSYLIAHKWDGDMHIFNLLDE